MIFQIINQVHSVYSLVSVSEQTKVQNALKEAAALKNSPVQIQIHAQDPNTLKVGEQPQIIGTIEPVLQNPLFYLYEGEKALIELCKGKEVYAVLSCPDLEDDINYKSYFQPDWTLQQATVHPLPASNITGSPSRPVVVQTRSNLREVPAEELHARTGEGSNLDDVERARAREERLVEEQRQQRLQQDGDQHADDEDGDDGNDDLTHEPLSTGGPRASAGTPEIVTKYIVYKSPQSPKSLMFAVYLEPIFSYVVTTKPLLPNTEYILNVSRDASIPQTTLDKTFEYTNTEGKLEVVKFKYTKAYPDTEKQISQFLDISLKTIYMLMAHGIQNVKQALLPALNVLGNMKVRSKIRLCANECSKQKTVISCNKSTESTKTTPCSTNTFTGKIWDYNLIATLSKYQISVCSLLWSVSEGGYSVPTISHLKKTFDAISKCNTVTSLQASIKAHLLYVWSKGLCLEINSTGILETENFLNCFNFDVSCAESIEEKICLKQVGCPVQDNSKSKDSKSTTNQNTNSENEEAEEGEEDNNSDEDPNERKKKGSNTFLYVSIAVVVVCVTSIAVYYVLA